MFASIAKSNNICLVNLITKSIFHLNLTVNNYLWNADMKNVLIIIWFQNQIFGMIHFNSRNINHLTLQKSTLQTRNTMLKVQIIHLYFKVWRKYIFNSLKLVFTDSDLFSQSNDGTFVTNKDFKFGA